MVRTLKRLALRNQLKSRVEKPLDASDRVLDAPPALSSLTFSPSSHQTRSITNDGRRPASKHTRKHHPQLNMAASSEAGYPMSDAPSVAATTPRAAGHGFPSSSSARPRGPPSESQGAASEVGEDGFADDQVPRSSRKPDASNIPPVQDEIGKLAREKFEEFLY